jgi:hypothetical protein
VNEIAQHTIARLLAKFPTPLIARDPVKGKTSIGIEIEVKWRYYFPQLWEQYMSNCSYEDLLPDERDDLTNRCVAIENVLRPKLRATAECGLPSGADKYWEFAFDPVTDVTLLDTQVQILRHHQLIPDGKHSLHITIGNLRITKDVYVLLLLLETLGCNPERIESGFNKKFPEGLSLTWAKKGNGGLYPKELEDLKHGATRAVELRTLEFDTENDNLLEMLKIASVVGDIIYDKQHGHPNPNIAMWDEYVRESTKILKMFQLSDTNWNKPSTSPDTWKMYMKQFNKMRPLLFGAFCEMGFKH